MFQKLVQGFDTLFHASLVQMSHGVGGSLMLNTSIGLDMLNAEAHKVFSSFREDLVRQTGAVVSGGSGGTGADPNVTVSSSSSSSSPAHSNSTGTALGRSIYPYEISPLLPMNPNSADMLLLFQQQSSSSQSQQMLLMQHQQQQQTGSAVATSMLGDVSSSGQQPPGAAQQANSGQIGALGNANSVYALTAELLRNMLDFMQHDVSHIFFIKYIHLYILILICSFF